MPKLTRLRAVRERRALSQKELAERAGVSRGALIQIESGGAEPRPTTVRKLAQALCVEPPDLMSEERPAPATPKAKCSAACAERW